MNYTPTLPAFTENGPLRCFLSCDKCGAKDIPSIHGTCLEHLVIYAALNQTARHQKGIDSVRIYANMRT